MKFIFSIIFLALAIFPKGAFATEGDILLFDDFNDGNFNGWTIESGNWFVVNGQLGGSQSGQAYYGRINTGSFEWDNYRVETDVYAYQGVDQYISLRYAANNFYEINLRYGTGPYDTPEVKLFKALSGQRVMVANTHSYPLTLNKWYHVTIEAVNENIKVWVENTLILDFTDPGTTIKRGVIGLSYFTGAVRIANVRFDNVKVTALAPPPSSKTPLVFIPGIGGSELKVNEDTYWIDKDNGHGGKFSYSYPKDELIWVNEGKAIEAGDDDYFDVLRMKTDGQTSEANLELTGNVYSRSYQSTIDFFTANGYTLDKDLFVFNYDWRKDISQTAPLLDQSIETIKQQTGTQKVDIMAHSLGGLAARNYIADAGKASKVRKLINIGTPNLGAVDFLKKLQYGGCLAAEFGPFCFSIAPSEVKDIAQNMISGYELAPSQKYFDFYNGSDPNHPLPFGSLNYQQLKSMLTNLNYNTALFTPSESFHNLDNNLSNTNGVDISIISGSGIATIGQILEDYAINFAGVKILKTDMRNINGDDTVPLFSSSLTDGSKSIAGSAKIYYTNQHHGNLASNGPAMDMVKNILAGNNPLPNQPYTFNGNALSVHSPVLVHAYDASGNHTGPLANGDWEAKIPGSSYEVLGDAKFIWLPDNGQYTIKFEATNEGSFDFKIKNYENNINDKTILYKNVPLTQNTKAETIFDTNAENPPVLQLDSDNNGTVDNQVNSTGTLTGNAVYDQTAPETDITLTGTEGNNGWYKSDVIVELTGKDEENGSGIARTEYSLDNGQTVHTYSAPFTISQEGINKLKFRSIDNAGNEETPKEREIKIDKGAPVINISASPNTLWPPNKKPVDVKISGDINDAVSGVASKVFSLEDEYKTAKAVISDFEQTIKLEAWRNGDDKDGRIYTIKVTGEDLAGNQNIATTPVVVPHDQGKK